jgi:RNA polymerase sigma-70 factor (ECF subfamily)
MIDEDRHLRPQPPERMPTDGEVAALVQQAQRGDETAFARLYEAYFDRVYRYIAFRVDSTADAEDLTEDVFMRMLESLKSFQWRDVPFSAWILRIAHNRVVDHWRRGKSRAGTPLDEAPPLPSSEEDPATTVETYSDVQDLREAMTQLTDLQRQVLSLRFGAGLSISETAKAMERNDGAVKALQHSAVSALRRIMVKQRQG